MSAAESEAVVNRLVNRYNQLGAEDFATYSLAAWHMLAHHAPEVVTFIFDRVDERIDTSPEARRGDD